MKIHYKFVISKLSLLLFLLHMIIFSFCQAPDNLWEYAFGGSDHERAFAVMEDENGNYLVAGSTKSMGNGGYDAYLLKLDVDGNFLWEKTYGGELNENIASLCPALYGGYVLAGYTSTDATGISDIWILQVDEEGDSLFSIHHGGLTSDQADEIIPNMDQGYTITSRTSVYMMGDQLYLMKLGLDLDTLWTKTYGGSSQDYGHAIIELWEGGYVIAGRSYTSSSPETGDAWVLRTDINGDTLWTKKYGGNDEDMFYAVAETGDGYIFAGQTRSFNAAIIDAYVVRTDMNGEVIWSHFYGGNLADYAYSIYPIEDDHYIIAGYSDSFNDNDDVYVFEIDGEGEVIWQSNYGISVDSERMYGSYMTADGSMVLTGIMDYYYQSQDDLFVMKLGEENNGLSEQWLQQEAAFSAYPNPASGKVNVKFSLPSQSQVQLLLKKMDGNDVSELFSGSLLAGDHDLECQLPVTPSGTYILQIKGDQYCLNRKLVIAK